LILFLSAGESGRIRLQTHEKMGCKGRNSNRAKPAEQINPTGPNATQQTSSAKWSRPLKFHLSNNSGQNVFTAHGAGYVQVNDQRFELPVIVTPEQVLGDWSARSFDTLTEADFGHFLALQPEVLLFGTGSQHRFAHPQLYRALTAAGIAVEFMNTPAACRTFNILMSEDRKVVAGILFD
jgi:uncharacterized protein